MWKTIVMALMTVGLAAIHVARAAEADDTALIKALNGVKITLQQGLTASQPKGRPISAKFEMEDGKLQLSVYVENDKKFFEVIVDHMSGAVAKTEPITEDDDLADAKSQSAAMARAKTDLKTTADKVAGGSAVVSITPDTKGGHPVASVVLVKDGKLQTVTGALD